MIYLDSSALVKMIVEEAESTALAEWMLARASSTMISSELARVEVMRTMRRVHPDAIDEAALLLESIDLLAIDREVIGIAADLEIADLRSLDAIHLATAALLGDGLEQFVAYDRRLLEAASARGLPVVTPGGTGR